MSDLAGRLISAHNCRDSLCDSILRAGRWAGGRVSRRTGREASKQLGGQAGGCQCPVGKRTGELRQGHLRKGRHQ